MFEVVGIPSWMIFAGVIIASAILLLVVVNRRFDWLEVLVDGFDESAFDLYITDLAMDMTTEQREILKDIAEILSPFTTRTPNDVDDKTLKILRDYVDANKDR